MSTESSSPEMAKNMESTGQPEMENSPLNKNVDPTKSTGQIQSTADSGPNKNAMLPVMVTSEHDISGQNKNKALVLPDPNSEDRLENEFFYIGSEWIGGNVHKCLTAKGHFMAVKKLTCRNRETRERILHKVKSQMSTLDHANISKVLAIFKKEQELWVVSPYYYFSLPKVVAGSGLNEELIAPIIKGTLHALSYLHKEGTIHGNVRMGNILIDQNGVVKLGDVGLLESTWGGEDLLNCNEVPYWYPSEILNTEMNWKFDIWAVGIVALELALGRPLAIPPEASDEFVRYACKRFCMDSRFYVEHGTKGKKFSTEFQMFVRHCLNAEASKRYSAEELLSCDFLVDCRGSETLRNLGNKVQLQKMGKKVDEDKKVPTGWKIHESQFKLIPNLNSRELVLCKQELLKGKWKSEEGEYVPEQLSMVTEGESSSRLEKRKRSDED